MAGHTVSAGVFKMKDAEPEATLELFSDYCEVMKRVFRLRRRIHPTTLVQGLSLMMTRRKT